MLNKMYLKMNRFIESHLFSSFIFGMLGALFISFILQVFEKPKNHIATVNVTKLVNQFVKETTKKNPSQDVLKKEVSKYGANLESTLKYIAKQESVILLPSEAVIAGAPDYTPLAERLTKLDVKYLPDE